MMINYIELNCNAHNCCSRCSRIGYNLHKITLSKFPAYLNIWIKSHQYSRMHKYLCTTAFIWIRSMMFKLFNNAIPVSIQKRKVANSIVKEFKVKFTTQKTDKLMEWHLCFNSNTTSLNYSGIECNSWWVSLREPVLN